MAGQGYDSMPPRVGAYIGKRKSGKKSDPSSTTLDTPIAQEVLGGFARLGKQQPKGKKR